MARMYSNGKGKSKTIKPFTKLYPTHVKMSEEEIKKIIIDLSKQGTIAAEIGNELRDVYGIGDIKTVTGQNILKILKENNVVPRIPDDIRCIEKKCTAIFNHIRRNWNDKDARFRLKNKESRLHRLARYYKLKGVLPKQYKPTSFKLQAKYKMN